MPQSSTYQISTGLPRRVFGARERIKRNAQELVAQTTEGETSKASDNALWFTDLRRGRLNIYGGLLRFIDHLHRKRVPLEMALKIPRWLESYIREVYGDAPMPDAVKTQTQHIDLAA